MNGVMPLDELLNLPAVIDFFAVLPMGPDRANPIQLVPGGSRESGVRLPSQLALQGLDPAGPVLRVLDFDDQDRPECEGRCGQLDDLGDEVRNVALVVAREALLRRDEVPMCSREEAR